MTFWRLHRGAFSAALAWSHPGDYTDDEGRPLPKLRGYSALPSARDLRAYVADNLINTRGARAVAFAGEIVGVGYDNEPLVIPRGKTVDIPIDAVMQDPDSAEDFAEAAT